MTTATTQAPAGKAKGASAKRVTLRLELLKRDRAVQSRVGLDEGTVESYAELMREGVEFPALAVFDDGSNLWLADGFHRAEAAERAGLEEFPCDVRKGTRRDAILHSIGSNAAHGLQRSHEDKRRAVGMLLGDEEWSKWSNREIARLAGVGKTLVNKMRRRVSPAKVGATRLARRGEQVYEMTPGDSWKTLTEQEEPPADFIVGWLWYLVRFTPRQFATWQKIVRERTNIRVLAEAVDIVMRDTAAGP